MSSRYYWFTVVHPVTGKVLFRSNTVPIAIETSDSPRVGESIAITIHAPDRMGRTMHLRAPFKVTRVERSADLGILARDQSPTRPILVQEDEGVMVTLVPETKVFAGTIRALERNATDLVKAYRPKRRS